MTTFQEGDVVRLKSGGLPMTVTMIGPDPMGTGHQVVSTQWFDREHKLQQADFNPATLEKTRA